MKKATVAVVVFILLLIVPVLIVSGGKKRSAEKPKPVLKNVKSLLLNRNEFPKYEYIIHERDVSYESDGEVYGCYKLKKPLDYQSIFQRWDSHDGKQNMPPFLNRWNAIMITTDIYHNVIDAKIGIKPCSWNDPLFHEKAFDGAVIGDECFSGGIKVWSDVAVTPESCRIENKIFYRGRCYGENQILTKELIFRESNIVVKVYHENSEAKPDTEMITRLAKKILKKIKTAEEIELKKLKK